MHGRKTRRRLPSTKSALLNGGRASETFSASLHPPDNNHEPTPRQLEMADTLAEIKEREFHARQAARGEERHQRAAPSSQQRRSEPVGAGGWLAIGILVALAIYASATGAGRGRGSRSLGMIAPHARSVDELEMLLELDKMLAGDLSDLAPRKPRRHPAAGGRRDTLTTKSTSSPPR